VRRVFDAAAQRDAATVLGSQRGLGALRRLVVLAGNAAQGEQPQSHGFEGLLAAPKWSVRVVTARSGQAPPRTRPALSARPLYRGSP
jgi:hypothetical protein